MREKVEFIMSHFGIESTWIKIKIKKKSLHIYKENILVQ